MIHYHGLPITPATAAVTAIDAGHAFVSYAHPDQLGVAAEACQSFAIDNGAFSAWKQGAPVKNWGPFYEWVAQCKLIPSCDFAVVPDVIDGSEADNDALLAEWPLPRWFGAPVWHMHESLERLERLASSWPLRCWSPRSRGGRSGRGCCPPVAWRAGPMADKYDDVLLPFLELMRRELHANSRKGDRPGWLRMDPNTALLEVYWHVAKLSAAVKNNDGPAIQEHSADVANMAMMVLDVCGGLALVDIPQREPIPVERLHQMRSEARASDECQQEHWFILFARAIERAHGVKASQPSACAKDAG